MKQPEPRTSRRPHTRYLDAPLGVKRRQRAEKLMPVASAVLSRTNAGRSLPGDDRRQTAMLALVRAVGRYERGCGVALPPYVTGVVRRELAAAGLRERRAAVLATPWGLHVGVLPDREDGSLYAMDRLELVEAAHRLIDGLPSRLAVVARARLRGASYGDIGSAIGAEAKTVLMVEDRAIRAVRRKLEHYKEAEHCWS